ncbi:hypothetical protein LCGC14_0643850 [marine sediment metagenome]|uniref:Homing endonuclease LAGLIDADG domain-containing protein n=1 Tax=marine sediment metagenome TaxID=412755 RepID=A0A0F9R3K9_9ZZZZ|nr:hypothetical protein [Pricia sp.]
MDNPLTQVELAYLAGLIDGEGTITLERTGKRRMNGVMGLSPSVIVANTDTSIVQWVVTSFERIGAKPYIKTQTPSQKNKRCKPCYWVIVKSLTKSKKILTVVKQYLIAKRAQADLILEFIQIRGDSQGAKGKPYGEREMRILDQIRALNYRGVSETEDYGIRMKIA